MSSNLKPFANTKPFNGSLADDYILGIQIGSHTDDAGLPEMMYIRLSKLKAFIREGFGELWHYRGEYNSLTGLPTDNAVNDYFLCTGTFTEGGVTYTFGYLYGWNGSSWDDISALLSQYATQAQLALKADKVVSPTVNDVAVLDVNGNLVDSGVLVTNIIKVSDIVDNVNTQDSQHPLSAKMGYELQQEINNLKARGRFLSSWNCVTGLPLTNPVENPYPYKAGDYFVVGTTVAYLKSVTPVYDDTADYAVGDYTVYSDTLYVCNTQITGGEAWNASHWDVVTNNYRPSGSSYTADVPSSVVETAEVAPNDFYEYDGTTWIHLYNTQKTVTFAQIAGQPEDNTNLDNTFNNITNGKTGGVQNATPYDPTHSYVVGEYCLKDNGLKKCKTPTTGAYDSTAWDDITLWFLSENSGNDVHLSIETDPIDNENKLCVTFTVETYDPLKTYYVGDLCIVDEGGVDVLKVCISDTTGTYNPLAWENHG